MAITFTFGNIKLSNVTTIQNELNRLRTKHGLAVYSFLTEGASPSATNMTDLKTKTTQLDQSKWIVDGSINVSSIPTFTSGLVVKESDFNSFSSVLATVDGICAYDAYNNYDGFDGFDSFDSFDNDGTGGGV